MKVTIVSATGESAAANELLDLGCNVRQVVATTPPAAMISGADVIIAEMVDDIELGGFVVRRARGASARIPLLLAVTAERVTRVEPSWGHDDFVLMPYVPQELYARLRAAEWNASEFTQPERIKVGDVVLDLGSYEASVSGKRITLTNREFELLVFLARRRGLIARREEILREVWGMRQTGTTRSLDVHVRRLRSKLDGAAELETVRGIGYKLVSP